MRINLNSYQYDFLFSKARFPAMISAWGTGKTMCGIERALIYTKEIPENLGIIFRKTFRSLQDSTIKDFERYTNLKVNSARNCEFPNKSSILFRHIDELDSINQQNINLGWYMIEQCDELETDAEFQMLRGRMRRNLSPSEKFKQYGLALRSGWLIGNTAGHSWYWQLWKNNSSREHDLTEATTFDNAHNLPPDFIEDLKKMKAEAPHHYNRYVMNSWEETDEGDLLVPYHSIERSLQLTLIPEGAKILSVDVARFGDDETVFSIVQKASGGWKQVYQSSFTGQDTVKTTGTIIDLHKTMYTDFHVIDDVGVGGGVTDQLNGLDIPRVYPFISQASSTSEEFYRKRDETYWTLKLLFDKGQLQILNDEKLKTQLSSIKFKYRTGNQKKIESKDEMKKRGLKSPDRADALMMAMSVIRQAEGMNPRDASTFKSYSPMSYKYKPRLIVPQNV